MLQELTDLQDSDEEIWGCAEVSFTIRTRADEGRETVEREYTFSHAPEWDKWMFTEYEEYRREDSPRSPNQNWRRERHTMWDDTEAPTVKVPPEVEQELEELLDIDEITIQEP